MKLYNKIGALALVAFGLGSCAVNDPFADNMEIGQLLPTVSWEHGLACKAGSEATFKAKYYFDANDMSVENIDHSEVWGMITRSEIAAVSCKLASGYLYTQTVTLTDTVRNEHLIKRFEHKNIEWNPSKTIGDFNKVYVDEAHWQGSWKDDGGMYNSEYHIGRENNEFVLYGSFSTSRTLSPVSWVNPVQWDDEKFAQLYPAGFKERFNETVVNALTKDSTYYASLRNVYEKYDFTKEQFETLNAKYNLDFPTETASEIKTDLWYSNTAKVVGKYYIKIVNGKPQYIEVPLGTDMPDVILYDVYESSKWVFCRYSDDIGAPLTYVRPEYKAFFKDLLSYISFEDWIYDGPNDNYAVNFDRKYTLIPIFKVYGTNNKVGYITDKKQISLN